MKQVLKMHFSVLGIIWLLLQSHSAFAQGKILGTVIDAKDKGPLVGATIMLEGGSRASKADENGKFEINVAAGSKLKISMTGYATQIVNAASGMTVELTSSVVDLEDIVVVGYGTQKRELLTGSVGSLKMTEARRNTPTASLGNLLAGQIAGVRVGNPAGVPGTQPSISIRTGSSFNAQNVLYVIDGKISGSGDFNNLSPNDIDNISVLKDAASAAVYGSRAAGGVVVVTTRRGTKNTKPDVNYSFSTGFDRRGKNADLTSAIETGEIYNRLNPTSNSIWTESDFEYFRKINNGWGYNQLDAVYQDPYISTHNLSASGGGEKVRYFVGGSYTKQGAFMKNLSFDKYNLRTNITADVTKNLTLFADFTINNNLSYGPPSTSVGDAYGIYRKQLLWQPEQPVWTDGGNPIDYGWIGNVGAEVRGDGGYVKGNNIKPIFNLKATYNIPAIPGLSATTQFNKSYTNNRTKFFSKQYNMWVMKTTGVRQISTKDEDLVTLKKSSQVGKNSIQENYDWSNDYQLNFQLNYEHTFGEKHNLKGWLIYEKAEAQGGGISAGRENFPVYLTDQWWAASGDRQDSYANGSTEAKSGRKSWVGQFFYDYENKYLASVAYRYDGSMNFSPEKRWGIFPSGSLGWIISKEDFFKGVSGIDMLKLRASAGVIGNDAVGGWQWQQSYQNGNAAYFGTSPLTNAGVTYGPIVNSNLTWEKTLNYNIGIDINFLKSFNTSLEYYSIKTYDILGDRIASVPPTFSRTLPKSNYGEIKAQGVEFSIGYNKQNENLRYYVNLNASYGNANYIIQDQNVTYPWQKNIGLSTTRITSYEVSGMLRTQSDLDAFVAAYPNYKFNGIVPSLGQLTYKDLSGPNGTPDGTVDSWDITTLKNNNNPINVGMNLGVEWKGFSLDATFNGNMHQYKFVNNLVDGNVEWNRMWRPWAIDAWTPNTPNATLPRRYSANDDTRSVTNTGSSFWLKNANFLRLRLLNIGYAIPSSYVNKIGISGIKLYFSGSNLFVLSKFNDKFYDPEIGDGFSYPTMKTFNFGINVSL
nr:SusC/RagA family TonB-linked outer membrane protein [uncultured Pedobacter sp.]